MHRLTVAILALALAASGCAGANPRWRRATRPWPAPPARRPRASPPGAPASAPARSPQGIRPQVFDAAFQGVAVNAEVVSLDGRQAEFTKPIWEYLDGAASAARRGRPRPGAPSSPRPWPPSSAATASTPTSSWRSGAWRRTTARNRGSMRGDREPRHPRLRGPPPRLRRGAAPRRPAHPAVGRRRSRPHARLLGGRHGPHPVHADLASSPTPSTSPATAGATSGRTTRPTRSPPPPTTSPAPAGPAASPGASRCACRRGSTTAAPTSRTCRPVADWRARGVTLRERPAAPRPWPGRDHRPRRRPRPGLRRLQQLLRHQEIQQRHLLRDGRRPSRRPDRRRRADRGRLATRRARALPDREDRAAEATHRPRLRHRLDRRRHRARHHRRHPRLPGPRGPDAGRLRHRLAPRSGCADGRRLRSASSPS